MPKYQFTERQKNMLRSIVPSLKDGTVSTEWGILYGDDRILAIHGLDDKDGKLWREVWDGVTEADFDDFVVAELFRVAKMGRYGPERFTLHVQRIIDAVENNFEPSVPALPLSSTLFNFDNAMSRIFISYSREDKDFVHQLAIDLSRFGADVWIDVDDVPAGVKWSTAIQQGLDACELMIVIISPDSMASRNVEDEWQSYLDDRKPIIPVLWKPTRVHFQLRRIQYIDFHTQGYEAALARLHSELQRQGIGLKPWETHDPGVQFPATPSPKPQISRVPTILPPPFEWIDIPAGQVELADGLGTFEVPAFQIAKYPLTNAQYAKFVEEGGYQEKKWWTAAGWEAREQGWGPVGSDWKPTGTPWTEPRYWEDTKFNGAEQPVVGVSWYEAVAFCRWLSEISGTQIMLPSEQQWQRAAQGDDGRNYPFGDTWDDRRCNNRVSMYGNRSDRTTPVQKYEGKGDSPFGVVDMAGNVQEWCLTVHKVGGIEINHTDERVLRGGSWTCGNTVLFLTFLRSHASPSKWDNDIGFRCAQLAFQR